MEKIDKLAIWAISLAIAVILGAIAADDANEKMIAAEHAKECQQAAIKEMALKKAEYNRLAKRGEYHTGMEAKQQ